MTLTVRRGGGRSAVGPRRAGLAAAALLLACQAALAGCSGGDATGPVEVAPPSPAPSGEADEVCRALADALPERVDGHDRRPTEGDSPYVAAWGDPAVTLRCGVGRPPEMTPGDPEYDPYTTDMMAVNEVAWLVDEEDGRVRFTTSESKYFVEVVVPDDYAPEVNPLLDLADPILATVPPDELHADPAAD
ncbi:DUF3515 domain-containing protein [Streptomyces sp. MS19]|uniref:DUF3515 domain-containing protein n=1 Tax=Streptomyces sp. MS19 TaxID=3385972 RepID=UPI0039A33E43